MAQYELSLFNYTALCYLIATVAYFSYVAFQKKSLWLSGFIFAALGAVLETFGLGLRWYLAGWDHPPFTNMYESLVFFAWGIVVVYLVIENRYKVRLAGAFVIPMAFAAMGLASLNPDKGIEPLVPALQSIWLHLHVATASIGYAAFLVAFGLSLLFLLKDRLSLLQIFTACSVINVMGILAVTKGKALFGKFYLDAVTVVDGVVQKIHIPGTMDPPLFEKVGLPVLGGICLVSILGYVIAAFLLTNSEPDPSGQAKGKGWIAFLVAHGIFTLVLAYMLNQFIFNPTVSIRANPYSFALITTIWFFPALLIVINFSHDSVLNMLPPAKRLDELAYRAIMVAFPIMTLIIITGAVWANQAWGRYWGWDPKETASLVTWIIYLIYLHTRITRGWTGRRTAYISIIGFVSVVFTYLGVNLLLSGLHAYATG